MTAWYLPTEHDRAQFAWAVGRKVGPAVVRNRLRRQLRAIVEELARAGRVPPGAYLVSVTPGAVGRPYEELKENVAATLRAVVAGDGPRPAPAEPDGARPEGRR